MVASCAKFGSREPLKSCHPTSWQWTTWKSSFSAHRIMLSASVAADDLDVHLRLGRQRQVWLIPLADETQGVQVRLLSIDNVCYTWDASCGGAIQIDDLYLYVLIESEMSAVWGCVTVMIVNDAELHSDVVWWQHPRGSRSVRKCTARHFQSH